VTSLLFGLSGALDMLLFYPAGKVMDRLGRLWVAVPSMLVMAVGLAILPFMHTVAGVAVAAAVLGVGNGMGSGIVMTLGADVAPADTRPTFLSVWRLFQDTGDAVGPLVLAGGAALGSLAAGVWATAALGAGSAAALARWVPRYSPLANLRRRPRR
jgi:MFS family permease